MLVSDLNFEGQYFKFDNHIRCKIDTTNWIDKKWINVHITNTQVAHTINERTRYLRKDVEQKKKSPWEGGDDQKKYPFADRVVSPTKSCGEYRKGWTLSHYWGARMVRLLASPQKLRLTRLWKYDRRVKDTTPYFEKWGMRSVTLLREKGSRVAPAALSAFSLALSLNLYPG